MPAGKAGRPPSNEWNALRAEIDSMQIDDLLIWKPTNGKSVKVAQKTAILHITGIAGKFKCIAEDARVGNQRVYLDKLYIIKLKNER